MPRPAMRERREAPADVGDPPIAKRVVFASEQKPAQIHAALDGPTKGPNANADDDCSPPRPGTLSGLMNTLRR